MQVQHSRIRKLFSSSEKKTKQLLEKKTRSIKKKPFNIQLCSNLYVHVELVEDKLRIFNTIPRSRVRLLINRLPYIIFLTKNISCN